MDDLVRHASETPGALATFCRVAKPATQPLLERRNYLRSLLRITFGMLMASTVALAVFAPALAGGNTQIGGIGVFEPDGPGDDCVDYSDTAWFTMKITGDLVGCWYNHGWEVTHFTPSGAYQERGTETFVGCLADGTTCGTFDTTYTFSGKYTPDFVEIFGRCQHPIVSGTGDFAGITGRVDFKDNVQTGEALYRGHLKLP